VARAFQRVGLHAWVRSKPHALEKRVPLWLVSLYLSHFGASAPIIVPALIMKNVSGFRCFLIVAFT
jgi:hypothetical protein